MRSMIILFGISGSGKSFLANNLCKKASIDGYTSVILSTDSVWQSESFGKYLELSSQRSYFNFKALGSAHIVNQAKCEIACQNGINLIVIDNTNLHLKDQINYMKIGISHKYEIDCQTPDNPWIGDIEEHLKKNVHDVPRNVLEHQLKNFNKLSKDEILNHIERLNLEYANTGKFSEE